MEKLQKENGETKRRILICDVCNGEDIWEISDSKTYHCYTCEKTYNSCSVKGEENLTKKLEKLYKGISKENENLAEITNLIILHMKKTLFTIKPFSWSEIVIDFLSDDILNMSVMQSRHNLSDYQMKLVVKELAKFKQFIYEI